jgi:hypothetical protein
MEASMPEMGESPDPVLDAWVAFMDADMTSHPEHIRPLSADLPARAHALVGDIIIDLDEDLEADLTLGSTDA